MKMKMNVPNRTFHCPAVTGISVLPDFLCKTFCRLCRKFFYGIPVCTFLDCLNIPVTERICSFFRNSSFNCSSGKQRNTCNKHIFAVAELVFRKNSRSSIRLSLHNRTDTFHLSVFYCLILHSFTGIGSMFL